MTKRMLIMLACVIVLVAGLAFGFYLHIQKLMASVPKPGPQTVSTIKAERLDWQPQLTSVGSLVPVRGVDVTTEVAGLVRSVQFKSGQDVKAGDLLVQLNADTEVAQLHVLQAAAELAEVVLKRDTAQLAAKAIAQAVVDADAADLKSKRAQVESQLSLVEKKTIRAPFTGRAGITAVQPGQYMNPGDKVVSVQQLQPIYANFNLPQQDLPKIALGQKVRLSVDAFPDQQLVGKVTALNPAVDTGTRNVLLQATVDNSQQRLLPGMFVHAALEVGSKGQFITLPQTAITYNPYGATVFILKPAEKPDADGKTALVAQQVFVTTGATRGDQVAILKGIEAGQEVVTSGQIKLKNGTPVTINNSVLPANSPNPTPQEH
jgi:membrane fusion protein (multidrug efflux system)